MAQNPNRWLQYKGKLGATGVDTPAKQDWWQREVRGLCELVGCVPMTVWPVVPGVARCLCALVVLLLPGIFLLPSFANLTQQGLVAHFCTPHRPFPQKNVEILVRCKRTKRKMTNDCSEYRHWWQTSTVTPNPN